MHAFFTSLSSVLMACFLITEVRAKVFDPESDYVNTSDALCAEYGILKKDEVLRLDLDLSGRGLSTVFLTFCGTGSKSGPVWTAYTPHDDYYDRADGIQFREDFLRAGKVEGISPAGGLLVLYPGKGAGNLVHYQIEGDHVKQRDVQKLDYSKLEDQQLFESIFGRKIDEPMPDDFFKKPPHKVIKVTDIMARQQASKRQKEPSKKASSDSDPVPFTVVKSQPSNKFYESNKADPRNERPAPILWTVVVILLASATGMVLLLFKKRK